METLTNYEAIKDYIENTKKKHEEEETPTFESAITPFDEDATTKVECEEAEASKRNLKRIFLVVAAVFIVIIVYCFWKRREQQKTTSNFEPAPDIENEPQERQEELKLQAESARKLLSSELEKEAKNVENMDIKQPLLDKSVESNKISVEKVEPVINDVETEEEEEQKVDVEVEEPNEDENEPDIIVEADEEDEDDEVQKRIEDLLNKEKDTDESNEDDNADDETSQDSEI